MELVFIRHGQSEWNAKNLFTGWRDVKLSEQGWQKPRQQEKLKEKGYEFDIAFTSRSDPCHQKPVTSFWKNPTNCLFRKSNHGV